MTDTFKEFHTDNVDNTSEVYDIDASYIKTNRSLLSDGYHRILPSVRHVPHGDESEKCRVIKI